MFQTSIQRDLNRVKAALWDTAYDVRRNASDRLNRSIKNKSKVAQHYLIKRPMKTLGYSLVTGLLTGLFLGIFMRR